MNFYARTDLACENCGDLKDLTEGAEWQTDHSGGFAISRLKIKTSDAERELGMPVGVYVTVECGKVTTMGDDTMERLSHILAGELRGMSERLTGKAADADFNVFVAGLGNAELTADAIGPKTVGMLTATRHLREHEGGLYRRLGCSSLSAMAPGVLGQTGIETLELLRGAVRFVRPDIVILVDALAARSCDRLAATVQISDVGISPGSGVGNHRSSITRESLGVPVISVGVPTVVNSATLVYDALAEAGIAEIDDSLCRVLENEKAFLSRPRKAT
jgi:spore protease